MGTDVVWLTIGVLLIAFLYSSVGHAGASGYLAVLALFGAAPATIKPTALVLNLLVASLAAWQFWRAGHFSWPLFWPFAVGSVPLAFAGGALALPAEPFKALVGLVLLGSAARFVWRPRETAEVRPPSRPLAVVSGGALGFLAGLTGTGGGIFLTPLMLFMGWARTRGAAAVSALFILCNSAAGLAGNLGATRQLPDLVAPLAVAVVVGGAVGSRLGSRRLPVAAIQRLLALVLTIAGLKLVFATITR